MNDSSPSAETIIPGPWIEVTCSWPGCRVSGGITIAVRGPINAEADIDIDRDYIWCSEHLPRRLRKREAAENGR